MSFDYRYWVDDDQFDVTYHVREAALPPPGNDHQLAELEDAKPRRRRGRR